MFVLHKQRVSSQTIIFCTLLMLGRAHLCVITPPERLLELVPGCFMLSLLLEVLCMTKIGVELHMEGMRTKSERK
jgi:hypothetical protein